MHIYIHTHTHTHTYIYIYNAYNNYVCSCKHSNLIIIKIMATPTTTVCTVCNCRGGSTTKTSQIASIVAIFTTIYHTKQLKSMAKLISQSCGEIQAAVSFPKGYAAI